MMLLRFCFAVVTLVISTRALKYTPDQVGYNLNENKTATDPLDYWGEWTDHVYQPSPANWRMPMYTLLVDRFVNGNPSNDNANGTQFEHDILSNQLRYGGDVKGLQDTLDYIQGMGVKLIYIAGTPWINMPWGADGYSPLDLTLLDRHHGDIEEWRNLISDMHRRGMYVIFDNTMATMGDLIGFKGYLNQSTPFAAGEHDVVWKSERRYHDFLQSDAELDHCDYPAFWNDEGHLVTNLSDFLVGCRDSEFDQYGEVASFGDYSEWQRQLSKFGFVQDRLREWRPSVLDKIKHFSCLTIASLDIDGYRIDKALQVTVDAQGSWSSYVRECARQYNKTNFYIPGEIVSGNSFGAIYIGRGMNPEMAVTNLTEVVTTNNATTREYVRDLDQSALDGAAFHYSIYRALTRFLGMDGVYGAEGDPPVNFVESWNTLMETNDMSNAYTGEFDPRHMFGVSNQDVFRWPGIKNGTEKNLLGLYIVTLLFPGIPTLLWGEEQAFYVLESTNANYVFGRAPMSSSRAWQLHGCYKVGSVKYENFPIDSSAYGCEDENISLDHRDPSHPIRNIIKRMFEMRENYQALNDGYYLQQLSNHTHDIYLPGSDGTRTETGLWSVYRSGFDGVQNFTGNGNQNVWLVYTNENRTIDYHFNCSVNTSLVSPFAGGTTVKNLFAPYEEYTLENGSYSLGIDGSTTLNGCLSELSMPAWGYKALIAKDKFVQPRPALTALYPGHDYRKLSTTDSGETVSIKLGYSKQMDCDSISNSIQISSTVTTGKVANINLSSVNCSTIESVASWVGEPTTAFVYQAELENVHHGVHSITVNNASASDNSSTNSVDRILLRVGDFDNPMVFPSTANYSTSLLFKDDNDTLYLSHHAPGADRWRYSLNFGTTWSDWTAYTGENSTLASKVWSGTKEQAWEGEHVIVQYWGQLAASSDHYQHGDLDWNIPRRFPNLWIEGDFNQHGYDAGLPNKMAIDKSATWKINFQAEWPRSVSFNAWGINPDGQPDKTQTYGDIDGDNVLDRIPELSLLTNVVNITKAPPSPFMAYRLELHDGSLRYQLVPVGSRWVQLALYVLLALAPLLTAIAATLVYANSFYQIKFNEHGVSHTANSLRSVVLEKFRGYKRFGDDDDAATGNITEKAKRITAKLLPGPYLTSRARPSTPAPGSPLPFESRPTTPTTFGATIYPSALAANAGAPNRRVVLIGTIEYDIEDWNIKVKIGGLGVMAQLMGKNLSHQDLIWVIPCVGDIDYPENPDEVAEPMAITILGRAYHVQVRTHKLRNITYLLLDAPVFRHQTKADPYPPRMDDLESAVYYSAWNSCIAEAIRRYKPDLYHINDYHGCVAPLHLLPETIPCALSLHNAEFQGLWPMRTKKEREEVCNIYNLRPEVVQQYVQFGEVFNLLHAGASYLRLHQNGFGAVGVSKKYGKRSWARYPIFWGLKDIGALPNPDPSDLAEYHQAKPESTSDTVTVDPKFEASRAGLRVEAQTWAGLNIDPSAELFVFVGRWSMQKGIDLIADVFPSILEKHPKTQLICVGPVIDLYGTFAAIKLERMTKVYPGRVFSRPEFTALPPCIFSGAEFALIPSRDEPFGLVAVEFGRKGALGVGARVGGLGQMPGWWYTIESTSTKHLLQQFQGAIEGALASQREVRAVLRARSSHQRFPVAQWVQDLDTLQQTAIAKHQKHKNKHMRNSQVFKLRSGFSTPATRSRAASRSRCLTPAAQSPSLTRASSRSRSLGRGLQAVESPWTLSIRQSARLTGLTGLEYRRAPGQSPHRDDESTHEDTTCSNEPFFDLYQDTEDVRAYEDGQSVRQYSSVVQEDQSERLALQTFLQENQDGLLHPPSSDWPLPNTTPQTYGDQTPPLSPGIMSPGAILPETPSPFGTPLRPLTARTMDSFQPAYTPAFSDELPRYSALLSSDNVVGERKDFKLQTVDPFFTDSRQDYRQAFAHKLQNLNGKNTFDTVIENFIEKSEKDWFNRLRHVKMGRTDTPVGSIFRVKMGGTPAQSVYSVNMNTGQDNDDPNATSQFLLAQNYEPPTGVKKFMLHRLGEWPVYSLILAFGQVIAANSYQITLLTGAVGQSATKLYVVASIYLATSILWWAVYRTMKSTWVLSLPFAFYGLAFFFIGVAPMVSGSNGTTWIQNVATACYATASSSGSLFFALNFGDQGGSPVTTWVFRSCVIQGTQQVYIAFLWCWGESLAKLNEEGLASSSALISKPVIVLSIGMAVAVLMWVLGLVLFIGLPDYYRQSPGTVPSFITSILRRKIVLWFFMLVILQCFFLSAPYGRNWLYLWSSQHLSIWTVSVLVVVFFIGVWCAILYVAAIYSKSHSWLLPIFAIGLVCPRWCQMLWGVSGIGQYVPWAGSAFASALAGRTLWLWLGVLDSLQNVGFGQILLHTLTRFHIAFTLIAAQILGSLATIAARGFGPDNLGPGSVFPDFSFGVSNGFSHAWFWVGLFAQILIVLVALRYFRKEQLSKP